jgi:FeS assembly SUF system protein
MDANPPPRTPLPLSGDKPTPDAPAVPVDPDAPLEERVLATLRTVYDPEIPVNIVELGLIYDLQVDESGAVAVRMTLTTPACPVAGALPGEIEAKIRAVPGVTAAKVELVWDPPWDPSKMSEAAQLELGLFG